MNDKDIMAETPSENTLQCLRDELVSLAEKHKIKYTAAYIKKASQNALEKIKQDHERKQLEETNEYLSDTHR